MGFELQLQHALQAVFFTHMLAPPLVDVIDQRAADLRGLLLAVGAPQPDEGRVGVAVDHRVALGFDQLASAQHDLVATQGNR
ncbi:hypothetical protein D9M71_752800 [compost metagenome]